MTDACAAVAVVLVLACAAAHAADGNLDPSFGIGGIQRFGAIDARGAPAVAVQPDGRIVVCDGNMNFETDWDFLIERFDPDGSPDSTFGVNGATTLTFDGLAVKDVCTAIALQADGGIVLVGYRAWQDFGSTLPEFAVARLDTRGTLDPTFALGFGYTVFPFDGTGLGGANAVAIDAQGRIVVAGGAQVVQGDEDFAVARLLPDGTLDASFDGDGKKTIGFFSSFSYDFATHVAIDAAGRILLAGDAGNVTVVTRLLDDGTPDPTFGTDGSSIIEDGPGAQGFLIDHAGRLVLAGAVAAENDSTNADMGIARLLSDGSPDTSFGEGGIASVGFDLADAGGGYDLAGAVVEQTDGKLVMVGQVQYGDMEYWMAAAARVLVDGTLDTSFGDDGKAVFDFGLAAPASEWFSGAALSAGRLVAVGFVMNGDTQGAVDDVVVRLQGDAIFGDNFD